MIAEGQVSIDVAATTRKQQTRARVRERYAQRTEEEKAKWRQRRRAYYEKNRDKIIARTTAWQKRNPKKRAVSRRTSRLRRYGLTQEAFAALAEKQNGKCAICGGPIEHIDHDHQTGKVRGLLCNTCNVGLGYFHDSVSALRSAACYLEQHNEIN